MNDETKIKVTEAFPNAEEIATLLASGASEDQIVSAVACRIALEIDAGILTEFNDKSYEDNIISLQNLPPYG